MNPFIAFRDLIHRCALAPYDTHQIKSIPLMTTFTDPNRRELYIVYGYQTKAGVTGFGRTTVSVGYGPESGLLAFSHIQEIERQQRDKLLSKIPDLDNLFLTNWQWLAPEPS